MTLEFEKLITQIEDMGASESARREIVRELIDLYRQKMDEHAVDFEFIDQCVEKAWAKDNKRYRAAQPIDHIEPINAFVPAPKPPEKATIISADGSQIAPDRHASYRYALTNVGVIAYHHGSTQQPDCDTYPALRFPDDGKKPDLFEIFGGANISIERDIAEIETLARVTWENRYEAAPLVAILDQRLLYWPIGGAGEYSAEILGRWQKALGSVQSVNGVMVGYIDRPMNNSVITMLQTLDIDKPKFKMETILKGDNRLSDAALFSFMLQPGERSRVFTTKSSHNEAFAEQNQEICFFYLNPSKNGRSIARIDIPRWAAQQADVVAEIHALVYDQCNIIGGYPYVLTRADELAVVKYSDKEMLDFRIELTMQREGIDADQTAKQTGKDLARAGKTSHTL